MTTSTVPSAQALAASPWPRASDWNRDSGFTTTGKFCVPLGEGLEVLLHEQGRRHQDRDLLAVLHRLERGPHGDLGLAVADVAADQPVHRDRLLHVGLDLVDGGELVGGLDVREGVLELALPRGVGAERVARSRPSARSRAGSARPRSARTALRARPLVFAQSAPPSLLSVRRLAADVPGDLVELSRWGRTAGRRAGRACWGRTR